MGRGGQSLRALDSLNIVLKRANITCKRNSWEEALSDVRK
jgi:hypothetical protein